MPGDVAAEPKAHSAPEIARQSLPTKFRFPDQEMERPKPRRHGRQIERGGATLAGCVRVGPRSLDVNEQKWGGQRAPRERSSPFRRHWGAIASERRRARVVELGEVILAAAIHGA